MAYGHGTTGREIVNDFKDQVKGKTFLITGPTPGGVGAETAISLAEAGPKHLILAGRNREKTQPLITQLSGAHPDVLVSFLELDLSSQKSVRAAVDQLGPLLAGDKVNVLILNGGVMACPFSLTEDGIERQFGTNHIGHFLFANLVLKQHLVTERIVVVSSLASDRAEGFLFPPLDDLTYDNGKSYDPIQAYSLSKVANMLYAKSLAKYLKPLGISAFSLNPGAIQTNLQVHMTPEIMQKAGAVAFKENPNLSMPKSKTLQQGCATQLRCALDPSLTAQSGGYFDDCQLSELENHAAAAKYEERLWKISETLVGEKFGP